MAKEAKEDGGILETVKTLVYAGLIAIVFRALFFQPFYIPSGSMKDTLLIGDFLFVNKMSYGYSSFSCEIPLVKVSFCPFIKDRWFGSDPERGDVIVFSHPVTHADFIKRLIGLPGDRIQVKDGVVYINGEAAPQEPNGTFVETYAPQGPGRDLPRCNAVVGQGGPCAKERLTETLPEGKTHDVLNAIDGPLDNTGVYTVPEGMYFFMGDNRDNSTDSRVPQSSGGVGFVPKQNLIGRADRVIFSSAGRSLFFFWQWRMDRFYEAIN